MGRLLRRSKAADTEHIQGQGGRILRYSSTQMRVKPSDDELSNYLQARDARLEDASAPMALQAGREALERLGYKQVDVDADYGVIRAEKDEVLISGTRQMLRGLLRWKLPLPGKPDHQTTEVLLTLKPGGQPRQVLLRANVRQIVWDSNGNSRTLLCSDPAVYRQLFDTLNDALSRPA
ncbi:hypothetical protein [Chromobacterium sp. CV08]|uniref:hypothetical protein n=1 Tax=Chromobacterium sp. CV08 TaxID=3133274 RepID=UPI003DA9FA2C